MSPAARGAPTPRPRRWDRLVAFVLRDNGDPGGVHLPLRRLGLPGWVWRLLTWVLAVADLVLLTRTPWAYLGLFLLFPLIWLVYTRYWANVAGLAVLGAGIVAVEHLQGNTRGWATALVAVLISLVTGTWVTVVQIGRARAEALLSAKAEALTALARAQEQLAAAEHAAGAAAERERWAREVHDTLAQGFVSVATLAQAAQVELEEPGHQGPKALRGRLAQIEEVARDNLIEARALVTGQGPSALSEGGLGQALERLVASQERHGLRISLSTELPEGLAPALQIVVLRLVQEALSNVVRHARAERVDVVVAPENGTLVAVVQDDGVGALGAPEGAGLGGMRSRVADMGGELSITALREPGAKGRPGTVIRVRMPL